VFFSKSDRFREILSLHLVRFAFFSRMASDLDISANQGTVHVIDRVPLSILYKKKNCPNRVHVPARLVQTFLPLPTTIHHPPSIFYSPCSVHTLTFEIYRYCRKCVAFVGCLLMPGLYQRGVIPHFGFLTHLLRPSVPSRFS